ncbi:CheR family methyltransferase [Actinocrispum wychmicini]|uniref:CheR methyltransferase-like protein n=1 Tax=Actinocrispum wychmicini TaxID=1213861 RepID=A0A4R2IIT3_9PSEU|nr:CheR family methyltransferase [Actinocrispum wychmicini]TCO44212.1 CheR methyltransferase-like protein [Actinocrispum wychmicini]
MPGVEGIVDRWNAAYFDRRLSRAVVAELRGLAEASADAQALADRAFRLMRVARQDPADLSLLTAWMIGFSVPRTVPSAWSGLVPPVTMAGRHRKLDEYVAGNPWHRPTGTGVFVDLGCGFPPFTTMDTARRLGDWRVVGVDPAFGRYLVLDADGAYACFDDDHRLRYYQSGNFDPDPAGTRARFRGLLDRLLPRLSTANEVGDEHGTLVRDPMRRYETGNLELVPGGIGEFELPGGADVVRCMNVFMYFDHPFRRRALDWVTGLLRPGGLFVCGSNWTDSAASRYTVYRKEADQLVAREFAVSVENARPIELAPWYALHDDNLENLANAHTVGTLRADADFRRRFDERLDAMLTGLGVCVRGADGYLGGAPVDMPADDLARCSAVLAGRLDGEGFVDHAVEVLRGAGRDAWRNHVGHVAMSPVTPPPLAPSAVL